MLDPLSEIHFLRPVWLVAILAAMLTWLAVRRRSRAARWDTVIAPHLLAHLRVGSEGGGRFRPIHLVTLLVTIAAIGAAGPTWEREPSPFAEDTAPLIVALDLSETMNATDVQPTRLERAKGKLRDLLEARRDARTALIAYAGTAHLVLPLSDDPAVFESYIEALATELMPAAGKNALGALALAERQLEREMVPGSVLFLTDGIPVEAAPEFAAHAARTDDFVLVLAIGTEGGGPVRNADGGFAIDASGRRVMATLDVAGLKALADQAGAFLASATADDTDVQRLQRRIQSHLRAVQGADDTARWRDAGYWLVWPVALLAGLWFRRGWTVRWAATLAVLCLGGCGAGGSGARFADLWMTADQQGRWYFEREEYHIAFERFEDPFWKGVCLYRTGDFVGAADWFARENTAESSFNLGNAYAATERFEEALASYDAALVVSPHFKEARENRHLVEQVLDAQKKKDDESPPGGDPHFDPDEIEFDEKGKRGKKGEVPAEQLTDQQIAELWLRRLQTTPADFLKRRFEMEAMEVREGTR